MLHTIVTNSCRATRSMANHCSLRSDHFIAQYLHRMFWHYVDDSPAYYFLRLYFSKHEEIWNYIAKGACVAKFHDTYKTTIAYKKFIGNKYNTLLTFDQIPETDKDNYVQKYDSKELMRNSQLPKFGQIDMSLDTIGKLNLWYHDSKELLIQTRLIQCFKYLIFKNQDIICLNTCNTGVMAAKAIEDLSLSIITGPNVAKVYEILNEFKQLNIQRPIVIIGSSTMMESIMKEAVKYKINLKELKLYAIVNKELSEFMRNYITDNGFIKCYSYYGASDLDTMIGFETDFEIKLRKLCHQDKDIKRELFGECDQVPMIFNYDPMNYYIEVSDKGELLYTCLRDDKISPRIKYNLKERGIVLPMSYVIKVLQKYYIKDLQPSNYLPLVCVLGHHNISIL